MKTEFSTPFASWLVVALRAEHYSIASAGPLRYRIVCGVCGVRRSPQ